MPDLSKARSLVRSGDFDGVELLYEDVPDTLSQLIRTAFIPRENALFYVADFSAIEARVIAWFAGESWRQQVFEKGGDIYCASATQMFKVPVEKHGINGHLRQKGKIVDLKREIMGVIKAVPNVEYQTILEKRYLCFISWEQIAVDMNYSMQHIHRMHSSALKEITVPKQDESKCDRMRVG